MTVSARTAIDWSSNLDFPSGVRQQTRVDVLESLAKALDVSPTWVAFGEVCRRFPRSIELGLPSPSLSRQIDEGIRRALWIEGRR